MDRCAVGIEMCTTARGELYQATIDATVRLLLFLAANPLSTDRLALDEEARAIQQELERSGSSRSVRARHPVGGAAAGARSGP